MDVPGVVRTYQDWQGFSGVAGSRKGLPGVNSICQGLSGVYRMNQELLEVPGLSGVEVCWKKCKGLSEVSPRSLLACHIHLLPKAFVKVKFLQ